MLFKLLYTVIFALIMYHPFYPLAFLGQNGSEITSSYIVYQMYVGQ